LLPLRDVVPGDFVATTTDENGRPQSERQVARVEHDSFTDIVEVSPCLVDFGVLDDPGLGMKCSGSTTLVNVAPARYEVPPREDAIATRVVQRTFEDVPNRPGRLLSQEMSCKVDPHRCETLEEAMTRAEQEVAKLNRDKPGAVRIETHRTSIDVVCVESDEIVRKYSEIPAVNIRATVEDARAALAATPSRTRAETTAGVACGFDALERRRFDQMVDAHAEREGLDRDRATGAFKKHFGLLCRRRDALDAPVVRPDAHDGSVASGRFSGDDRR